MIYTITLVLIILWLLGVVIGSAIGGFIHNRLAIAIIMALVNFIFGRKRGLEIQAKAISPPAKCHDTQD